MKNTLSTDERTRCEVWTRVMGYHRPVATCNVGKRADTRAETVYREATVEMSRGRDDDAGFD